MRSVKCIYTVMTFEFEKSDFPQRVGAESVLKFTDSCLQNSEEHRRGTECNLSFKQIPVPHPPNQYIR